jgi:hypothetical protein
MFLDTIKKFDMIAFSRKTVLILTKLMAEQYRSHTQTLNPATLSWYREEWKDLGAVTPAWDFRLPANHCRPTNVVNARKREVK